MFKIFRLVQNVGFKSDLNIYVFSWFFEVYERAIFIFKGKTV